MIKNYKFDFNLFDSFQDMCFIISEKGEILILNKAVYDTLKFTPGNLVGQNFLI